MAERKPRDTEHLPGDRGESAALPWFLHCLRFPPADPLTRELIALVDGLEPIPGPKTVGETNYARIFSAFCDRGWVGFEEEFNQIIPRDREDYVEIKRDLLREPIFMKTVHQRMARIYTGKATIDEVFKEIEQFQMHLKTH